VKEVRLTRGFFDGMPLIQEFVNSIGELLSPDNTAWTLDLSSCHELGIQVGTILVAMAIRARRLG
jgi:hypothetical protein